MKIHIDYIDQTESTNSYLAKQSAPPSSLMKVIVARSQSAGRGQGTNSWESEEGKNLTFSLGKYAFTPKSCIFSPKIPH